MIAIRTNKEIYFSDGKGFVTMKIVIIQNDVPTKQYVMKIIDTCEKEIDVEGVPTIKQVGKSVIRFKTMTYDELDALYDSLNMEDVDLPMREKINESFRQGLLLVTQKECIDGISGEEGKGQYYSEAQDWYIIRPQVNNE